MMDHDAALFMSLCIIPNLAKPEPNRILDHFSQDFTRKRLILN